VSKAPIIIVGTGLAGYNLAKNIRAIDSKTPVTLCTEGLGHFYSKPMLSTALSQKKSASDLIMTKSTDMETKHNLNVLSQAKVTRIIPEEKTIVVEQNHQEDTLKYSKLVLALGASPKSINILPQHENIFQINQWEDYEKFRNKLKDFKRIAIIGSGLVGCEFAHDLSCLEDCNVSLLTPEDHCLAKLVDEKTATKLQQVLTNKGVNLLTQIQIKDITIDESINIKLEDKTIEVDAVISAIGISANTSLAEKANITTQNGIVINKHCETNIDSIYAIGDCAEFDGQCLQYVAPLLHQTQQLAKTLTGTPQAINYPKMPVSLKTASYPILHLSPNNINGQWTHEDIDGGIIAKFYNMDNKLCGFTLSGKGIMQRMALMKDI
jgi:rubredoxin-NAD+ reductase